MNEKPNKQLEMYIDTMKKIRDRFDAIDMIKKGFPLNLFSCETLALHSRKIIEAVFYGCLIAAENGLRTTLPRDVMFNWNPDKILTKLQKKKIDIFPSPSIIRAASPEEIMIHRTRITIEGQPDRRIEAKNLIKMYEKLHPWLHERNPYKFKHGGIPSDKDIEELLSLIQTLYNFIEKHVISINGKAYFAVIKDSVDNLVKVVPLSKVADI